MIVSSSQIADILRADPLIKSIAQVSITESKPSLEADSAINIYISKYPVVENEFSAFWDVWIVDLGEDPLDVLLTQMRSVVPGFSVVQGGFVTKAVVRSLISSDTELRPVKKADPSEKIYLKLQRQFNQLVQDINDRMLLVTSGKNGKDGQNGEVGPPGPRGLPGRDGRDINATETEIGDLKDVELEKYLALEKGQVLTFDGESFTNLLIPKISTLAGGGGTVVTASGANVIISDAKPLTREDSSPLQAGDEWWNSMTGVSFIWYVDDDSSQWVQQSGTGSGGVNTLNDLQDVTIDPELLARDQGLLYDGGQWTVGSPPVLIDVVNTTGLPISKATPVCVTGTAPSGKPEIEPAANNDPTGKPAIGLVDRDIGIGEEGYVLVSGKLFQTDTSTPGYADGDALYLSSTPGVLTNVRPLDPSQKVQKVGLVTRVHPTVGTILVIGAGRANDVTNEIVELTGVSLNATNLGTFAGATIGDNGTIKGALQDLEGAVEDRAVEAPQDGNYYVRQNGAWIELGAALTALGYNFP